MSLRESLLLPLHALAALRGEGLRSDLVSLIKEREQPIRNDVVPFNGRQHSAGPAHQHAEPEQLTGSNVVALRPRGDAVPPMQRRQLKTAPTVPHIDSKNG